MNIHVEDFLEIEHDSTRPGGQSAIYTFTIILPRTLQYCYCEPRNLPYHSMICCANMLDVHKINVNQEQQ